jgi:hypothetical protein
VRVLLDECVPRKLRRELQEHEVRTVVEAGWSGKMNGQLLRLAAEQFDVFLTVETNVQYQQDLARHRIAVVVVLALSNDINVLRSLNATGARVASERAAGYALPRRLRGLTSREAGHHRARSIRVRMRAISAFTAAMRPS